MTPTVVDGHLDIAFNHLCFGRDPRRSALETRAGESDDHPLAEFRGSCMVGLPELRRGRVAVVFATIFLADRTGDSFASRVPENVSYDGPADAAAKGRAQLDVYHRLSGEGKGFRLVGTREELNAVTRGWENGATGDVGLVPLMEGADPIRSAEDVARWVEHGVRIVGLAWRRTRYSGGTGNPGPLTAAGRGILPALEEHGVVLDLSHSSEQAFHESLERFGGPVIASHANPRAFCDGDRQLTDEMIRAITSRGGIVGSVPFNQMLVKEWKESGRPQVPLRRVAEVIQHVANVAGTHRAAAVGSDLDGGFGAEQTPQGLDTVADLGRLADPLSDLGFSDEMIRDVLGGNWIRFLESHLPSGTG